ncbi:hypothetical protein BGX20_005372, partial [Mortierella sp. AD010]
MYEEMELEHPLQVFRPVYKDVESGNVTPLSNTITIEPRLNTKTRKYIILWNDNNATHPHALHMWRGQTIVPCHTDENFDLIQPLRFSTYPGIAFNITVKKQGTETAVESHEKQDLPAYTSKSSLKLPSENKKPNVGYTYSGGSSLAEEINDMQVLPTDETSLDLGEPQGNTASATFNSGYTKSDSGRQYGDEVNMTQLMLTCKQMDLYINYVQKA